MCAGAAWAARVPLLVFGAADPKAGAAGSLYNFAADPRLNHTTEVVSGVRADECGVAAQRVLREPALAPSRNISRPEGCESGRIGWSRKPLWRKPPWVQIPLPPLVTGRSEAGSG